MGGFWTLSRYEDVKAAVSDWRRFTSAVPGVTGIPMMIQRDEPLIPIEYDPPQHTRYRTLVSPLFRRDRVEQLRPIVRAFADELLDPLIEARGGDFGREYAKQLSLRTLGAFLGLPQEDAPRWAGWVEAFHRSVEDRGLAVKATQEFNEYLDALIGERRATPGTDFVSLLTQATLDGKGLSDDEVRKFTIVVIAAGFETTAGGIGLMLHHLAHAPHDYSLLRETPDLVPTAVDEFLRLYTPIQLFGRNAACDVVLHGQQIRSGEVVAVAFAAANRDPAAFTEPDRARSRSSPEPPPRVRIRTARVPRRSCRATRAVRDASGARRARPRARARPSGGGRAEGARRPDRVCFAAAGRRPRVTSAYVTVDPDACLGSSACTFHAPNTFAIGADGLAHVVDPEGDDREDIELAAADCPTQAIRLSDGAR